MRRSTSVLLLLILAWAFPSAAQAIGNADVAALQVALKARGLYAGSIDGDMGPGTQDALRRFQSRKGLVADGVAGAQTRLSLGRYGRRAPLGHRVLHAGTSGWDVASLQFLLAWHGFPSGNLDGSFGDRTDRALRAFQLWRGLPVDGRAGAGTVAALRSAPPRSPIRLAAPCAVAPSDPFGPRGRRFHTGLDYPAPAGTPVVAAASGRVTHAGPLPGGWGKLVVIDHGQGVETWYAHLRGTRVRPGQTVVAGALVGVVGATGHATGPHLHFELRLRGAAVDPLTGLS